MKVLVAEDNLTSRRMMEAILVRWGYEVVSVANGKEAWDILQAPDAPKIALLDWMMPELHGVEVCRRVRDLNQSEPTHIIILTARGMKNDVVKGLEAGANDFVPKPFDSEELRARIQVGKRLVELQSALADRIRELQEALSHVKTLQGLLPICMNCHKIRDDQETWHRLETYVEEHSEAELSFKLCPECLQRLDRQEEALIEEEI
jgi:DNA-binding response OmpR family regulator